MADPKIELKVTIGDAERLTVSGKNLEKLTGRRLRSLNINLQKKIKEERAKAIREERKRVAARQAQEQKEREQEAEVERKSKEEANIARRIFKLKTEYHRVTREIEAGTASEVDKQRKDEIEKEIRNTKGGKKVLEELGVKSKSSDKNETPSEESSSKETSDEETPPEE